MDRVDSESRKQPELSGWLFKWTNYLRGYQRRWFVLSGGLLSYYRSQEDMAHSCRGTLSLQGATVSSQDFCTITVSNGETYHIKAPSEAEKLRWVVALELARDISDAEEMNTDHTKLYPSLAEFVGCLGRKFEELRQCNSLVNIHGAALQESLSLIVLSLPAENVDESVARVNESTALFMATTSAMVKGCSEYLDIAEHHSTKWNVLFEHHRLQRPDPRISENLRLNRDDDTTNKNEIITEQSSEVDAAEFYDCDDSLSRDPTKLEQESSTILSGIALQMFSAVQASGSNGLQTNGAGRPKDGRRTRVPDRPPISNNLWSIIKNCIGKDLSRIPVPASWCEPLSLLQRLTEDLEYSHVLDIASGIRDPGEQLAHVAGFAVSSYSTTVSRTGKPFNPLLGETYECDRTEDKGWRSVAEQVSHHPPIAAFYSEGKTWEYWQQQSMTSKFRGKYMQITPLGEKVMTNINNVIIGKLWIDQEGDMLIKNHTNGYKCKMTFFPFSMFSRDVKRVKGTVYDDKDAPLWTVAGSWEDKMVISRVLEAESKTTVSEGSTDNGSVVWQRVMPPNQSEKYYNFTIFACQLNEMENGVAPTDSRLRPDQRFLENGEFEEADKMKLALEEKQRVARRRRAEHSGGRFRTSEAAAEFDLMKGRQSLKPDEFVDTYQPAWFKMSRDPDTNTEMHIYNGEYWPCKKKKDWSRCPDIF
ncbi:unnamed protein product [Nesidiocoris tenuis]|uniref:Oxysterol-binding protein n=1 Tax=Nesidiocoris tenuis TaxID=355587 RepID=A0A6H5FZY6_9HEMI|nr:unnamed protein product [Nesidiocoris tenuis]